MGKLFPPTLRWPIFFSKCQLCSQISQISRGSKPLSYTCKDYISTFYHEILPITLKVKTITYFMFSLKTSIGRTPPYRGDTACRLFPRWRDHRRALWPRAFQHKRWHNAENPPVMTLNWHTPTARCRRWRTRGSHWLSPLQRENVLQFHRRFLTETQGTKSFEGMSRRMRGFWTSSGQVFIAGVFSHALQIQQ